MSGSEAKIAVGFKGASAMTGLSTRFLQLAAAESDPARRLKTVRVNRRRLIRVADLQNWFDTVAREENGANDEPRDQAA